VPVINGGRVVAALAVLLSVMLLQTNLHKLAQNCVNAVDFSIYQQGAVELADGVGWNPYSSVRGVRIFNDHFDPVLLVAAGFLEVVGSAPSALIIFEWLWWVALLVGIYCSSDKSSRLFLVSLAFLSRWLWGAFLFPIHPTTWAALPLFWVTWAAIRRRPKTFLISAGLLCLFKESYAFALIPLTVWVAVAWDRRLGVLTGLVVVLFVGFELFGRAWWLGPTIGYGSNALTSLLADPWQRLLAIPWWETTKAAAPFILAAIAARVKTKSLIPALLLGLPLLAIQLANGRTGFQYGAQFAGVGFGLLAAQTEVLWRVKWMWASLLIGGLTCMGTFTSIVRLHAGHDSRCRPDHLRTEETARVRGLLSGFPRGTVIAATGGVIPHLVRPSFDIRHLGGFSPRVDEATVLVLELGGGSDTYPLDESGTAQLRSRCLVFARHVHLDTPRFFLAEGDFARCL
jgi:hypothetical protein